MPDDMFVDLSKEEGLDKHRFTMFINNRTEQISEDKFKELFYLQYYKRTKLFMIGPIYQIDTVVKRKADGKVLGRSTTLNNKQGWLSELKLYWHNSGERCPIYRDKYGKRVVNSDHDTLIDRIFHKVKSKEVE